MFYKKNGTFKAKYQNNRNLMELLQSKIYKLYRVHVICHYHKYQRMIRYLDIFHISYRSLRQPIPVYNNTILPCKILFYYIWRDISYQNHKI